MEQCDVRGLFWLGLQRGYFRLADKLELRGQSKIAEKNERIEARRGSLALKLDQNYAMVTSGDKYTS